MSDAWATEWALWMVPVVWQATLLAVAVLVIDLLLRRIVWPQLLHALWLLVLLRLFLPPHVTSPVAVSAGKLMAAPAAPPVAWMIAWASGVALFGIVAIRARVEARRALRRSTRPVPVHVEQILVRAAQRLDVRRRVVIVASSTVASPGVHGLIRPRIVIPATELESATDRELEHVFLHELAHVARGDLWVRALFRTAHLLFWFHPLVFVARRRAHALGELCCDARVASVLGDQTPAYRATLLRFAARLLPEPRLTGFLGGPALIVLRLRRLDRGEWVISLRQRIASAGIVLATALILVPRAQAGVIDPAVASLRAERTRLAGRVRELAENYESEGCLELQWSVRRLIALEQEERENK